MWAILTVVVVFEFYVGATLGKGLNKGLATFLAGALGFGAHHLATLPGDIVRPILLGIFVFILGSGDEYFAKSSEMESNKASLQGYKSILNSKQVEESLVNSARWELRHGRFKFCHPWKQYLKVASLTQQCAYRVEALNGCLDFDVQELASAIKTMSASSSHLAHIAKVKDATEKLNSLLKTRLCEDIDVVEILAVATVASLLHNVLAYTEKISESVHELATIAHFKNEKDGKQELDKQKQVQKTSNSIDLNHHVITVE
ncbi:putative Aluminum activated malate transporter family protein [Hibiscus syriacus]|uniref:Aluminum activated malate transporter family protein n=1 Tax=Hibiscus syriacus TaxID=106335 RepID=A0A6A2Y511_HIBSY|nr:putative Aluminum activated malate transporter family protein [Hibiscus syriacus]